MSFFILGWGPIDSQMVRWLSAGFFFPSIIHGVGGRFWLEYEACNVAQSIKGNRPYECEIAINHTASHDAA